MGNTRFVVVPPPGAGFVTVTFTWPAVATSGAAMAAVICVAFTTVVVLAAPLKLTTEEALKFVPFTVSVKAAPPAVALVGKSVVIVGTGLPTPGFTVKLKLENDCPPPGDGVNVNIEMLPEVGISPDGMVKVAELELQGGFALKSWSIPLKRSFVPAMPPVGPGATPQSKFVPVTATSSGFPALPAFTLPGVTEAMVGCGPRIVNAKADETLAELLSPTVMAD